MKFGQYLNHIENVDMFKDHLRLVVKHPYEGRICILLDAKEAQSLVNEIYAVVDTHRSNL